MYPHPSLPEVHAIFSAYALVLVVVLGITLSGLAGLWLAVLWRPRRTDPACGQCGYLVKAIEVMTCPECGGDFRAVWIVEFVVYARVRKGRLATQ